MQVLKTSVVYLGFVLRVRVPVAPFQRHDEMFLSVRAHFVEDEAQADQGHVAQRQFITTRQAHGSNVELMKEHS
jgi:hypothetical protein